jgi:tetratricopeptide (TPR) repeat protein
MRVRSCVLIGISLSLCLGPHTNAQQLPADTGAPNPTLGPEATSPVGKEANYSQLDAMQNGSVRYMGKVKVQGAAFPWDPIPVVVVCGPTNKVEYRTMADAKGNFNIRPQKQDELYSEISPHVGKQRKTAAQLTGCNIRAELAGFKSTSLHIAFTSIMDNPDLGTVVLTPDGTAAGSSVSTTYAKASPAAIKDYNKARGEYAKGNAGGAEKDLKKAVKADPNFADAWYQLGHLQQEKKPADALKSYQKAVAADPNFVSPYLPIAVLAANQKDWKQVKSATDQALKLDPEGNPQVFYYNALGDYNTGDASAAEASAKKSLAMDPEHVAPKTEQLLAVIEAGQGDLNGALHHLQHSLTYLKPGPDRDLVQQQIAQLQKAGAS